MRFSRLIALVVAGTLSACSGEDPTASSTSTGTPPHMRPQRTPAPLMGQHNRAIAKALGYSEGAVEALVKDGVLYAEAAVAKLGAGRT